MKKIFTFTAFLAAALLSATAAEKRDSVAVSMPWNRTADKEISTGDASAVSADALHYPSTDLRTMLSGLFPGLDVSEVNGELHSFDAGDNCSYNMFGGSNSAAGRYYGNIICLVDDIPMSFNQIMLDPNQIESISFSNSITDKVKFGPLGSWGIVSIRTKHGKLNSPLKVNVNVESGISTMDRTGEWVNGVEYATLNNRARKAAGYPELFSSEAIEGFSKCDPNDRMYPNADYRSLLIKETKPVTMVSMSANGGTKTLAYSFNLSGVNEGGYIKGGVNHDYSRINFNSNVSTRIGRHMKASVGAIGSISLLSSPNINYSSYRTIPATAYPVILGTNDGLLEDFTNNTIIYGVSKNYDTNYYAALRAGRLCDYRSTTGSINAALDIDFGWLVKGLKSRTAANLGVNDMVNVTKSNDYIAYYMTTGDENLGDISAKHQGAKSSGKKKSDQSFWQQFNFYEDLSWSISKNGHNASASATYYLADTRSAKDTFFERQQDFILSASYNYDKRYTIEVASNYSGSSAFTKENRYCMFPSVGLSWTASNESFLKNSSIITFLKFRAQSGVIGSQSNVFSTTRNLWDSRYSFTSGITYGPASNGRWFGNQTRSASYTTMTRFANPDLDWEKLYQNDLGIDMTLFGKLDLMAQVYTMERKGIITETSKGLPSAFGIDGTSLYENYNGIRTYGAEFAAQYSDRWGDFGISFGGTASIFDGTNTVVANDVYLYEWQKVTGTAPDVYRGYICLGKFESEEQAAASAKLDSRAGVGDLMYKDLNNDGTIDSNDITVIGKSSPRLRYSVNLQLSWKDLEINAIGTGRANYDVALNNEYYWNGWGDGNYSAFVRDNIGGAYPTLSYLKSSNNFVLSDFWLRSGAFFKIQNVEVAYTLKGKAVNKAGCDRIRIFARGANLLTISGIKDLDPESLSAGVTAAPLYKTFTGGARFTF